MIELKGSNWSIAQIREVVNLLKDSAVFDQVAISSLRLTVLERVHRLAPKLDTQLIVSGWRKVRASLGLVEGYNAPASSLTKSRVKRLHRKGIRGRRWVRRLAGPVARAGEARGGRSRDAVRA